MSLLKFIAAICLALAVLVAWGTATFTHDAVLLPLGLLLWLVSELPFDGVRWSRSGPGSV